MRLRHPLCVAATVLSIAIQVHATIFASVRGIVHDPGHRPVEGAQVTIQAKTSDWSRTVMTSAAGEFQFDAVPVGDYAVSVTAANFAAMNQQTAVISGSAQVLHFQLALSALKQNTRSNAPFTSM